MKKLFTLAAALLAFALHCNAGDYSTWGKLKVVGNQLCSQSGEPVQLRGWSTFGHFDGLEKAFNDEGDFQRMKQNGANLARIAMYINEGKGYQGNQDYNKQWVKDCIKWCKGQNMYCIVDWHILKPGNPNDYSGAEDFFREICQYAKNGGYDNVIYEICNEPNIDTDTDVMGKTVKDVWENVKKYAAKVLPVIKQGDGDAIVLVGTPQWDQGLAWPLQDPLDECGLPNVMYSFHSYAGDQRRYLGYISSAAAFMPIFVSEWGLSSHTGDGGDFNEAKKTADMLMDICAGKNLGNQIISWANWSWCDKGEVASSFTNYDGNQWSQSGEYVKNALKQNNDYSNVKSEPYNGEPQVFDGFHDLDLNLMKYDKGGSGVAFFDNDEDWKNRCSGACNMGNAGALDGIRDDEAVDLGYTYGDGESGLGDGYYSLGWISQSEWVKYTMDIKIAGIYEFEIFTSNRQHDVEAINKVAFALDGKNCLVEEDGKEYYKVVDLTPCHGGTESTSGYQEWGWAEVKSSYASGKKFYLKLEQGTHVFAGQMCIRDRAFMATSAGLGTVKFKGKPENEFVSVDDTKANHNVSIWPNPAENGNVNISVDADAEVDIFSVDGVNVYSGNVAAGATNELNLNLPAGVYSVSVKSAQGVTTNKLIVK